MKKIWLFFSVLTLFAYRLNALDLSYTDGAGRIVAMTFDGKFLPVATDIWIVLPGWSYASLAPWFTTEKRFSFKGSRKEASGKIIAGEGAEYRYLQVVSETNGIVTVSCSVTAEQSAQLEGIYFFVHLPLQTFSGAVATLKKSGEVVAETVCPQSMPAEVHFLAGKIGDDLTIEDSAKNVRLELLFEAPRAITVQDDRKWGKDNYSIYTKISGSLQKGETVSFLLKMKLIGIADHSDVHVKVNAGKPLARLDGFGGNFVYGRESPAARYALENLNIAWARTRMSLDEWVPEYEDFLRIQPGTGIPSIPDKNGTALHSEFQLAKELATMGIPFVISVWNIPEWLCSDPSDHARNKNRHGRIVPEEKWPQLFEAVGSYLSYLKRVYGAEPALFSFNEPEFGVMVRLSDDEHRRMLSRLGDYLAKRGLKTRMLLGDVSTAGRGYSYCLPAAEDSAALKNVGAIAFHSWGGATAAEYARWPQLAGKLKLPLLVTEAGVDPNAWHTPEYFHTFQYAMLELQVYQEMLLYARPQGLMEWELTEDYSTVRVERDAATREVRNIIPEWRFCFLKHFANLTPVGASYLQTVSSTSEVLCTAFSAKDNGGTVYTFHIANLGPARRLIISGLPSGIRSFRVFRTSENEFFRQLQEISPERSKLYLDLAEQSLTTITTLRGETLASKRRENGMGNNN